MAMSAGVCGKRVCFEEIFGFSSAAKRSRISSFGSGFEDKISILIQMFPALNYEVRLVVYSFRFFHVYLCFPATNLWEFLEGRY